MNRRKLFTFFAGLFAIVPAVKAAYWKRCRHKIIAVVYEDRAGNVHTKVYDPNSPYAPQDAIGNFEYVDGTSQYGKDCWEKLRLSSCPWPGEEPPTSKPSPPVEPPTDPPPPVGPPSPGDCLERPRPPKVGQTAEHKTPVGRPCAPPPPNRGRG